MPQLIKAYKAANRSFMVLVRAPDGTHVTILFRAIQNANDRIKILNAENIIDINALELKIDNLYLSDHAAIELIIDI